MFFKLWVICLVLFLICVYSVTIPIKCKAKNQFTKEELEYKILKEIRKANGKQTLADTLDDFIGKCFKSKQESEGENGTVQN